jgi:hypothetical protein
MSRHGRRIIERQRRLIDRLNEHGHDTAAAEDLLLAFERAQAIFEADLAAILRRGG